MRNLSLFSKALSAVALLISLMLGSCDGEEKIDPESTLSLHALLADAMEMDMNQDTLMNPSEQAVTNEGDVPGAEIEAITKKDDLGARVKEQKELNETLINVLCKGRGKDCLPAFLTRIGENCNGGKCSDFSRIKRLACLINQQITVTIRDARGNTVFNSTPGNQEEILNTGGTVRLISIPQGLNAGQSYNVVIEGPNFPTQNVEGRF